MASHEKKPAKLPYQDLMDTFLKVSPRECDGNKKIGVDPRNLDRETLLLLGPVVSLIKVIRARCINCCMGDLSEVRKCTAIDCPSWRYRMGVNTLDTRFKPNQPKEKALAASNDTKTFDTSSSKKGPNNGYT